MNVLVMGSVLPAPVEHKKNENDVQFVTAEFHEKDFDIKYYFIHITNYSNWFLSLFSKKWKSYRELKQMKTYKTQGHEVLVIWCPGFRKDRRFRKFFSKLAFWISQKQLRSLVKSKDIDLIHAQDIFKSGLIASIMSKRFNIPFVVTTRGPRKETKRNYAKNLLKTAKACINLNKNDLTESKLYNENSYLVPHGLNKQFLEQQKTYSLNAKVPLKIVTLCRLLDWKNIDKVLWALNDLNFEVIFDIYGRGTDKKRLVALVQKLGLENRVHFKGFLPYEQVPTTLKNYDVFVLPSYFETMGRVFFEAMACGLPIIGAKGCGVDGYITSGKEGFSVNHQNIDELKNCLIKLNQNRTQLKQMGENAKKLSQAFSWTKIISKIDNIYRDAVS